MLANSRSFFTRWTPAEIMLAVLFLVAPLYYHPNLGGVGLRIPHNSTIWLVALAFIVYSLIKVIRSDRFRVPRYFWFIAAFQLLAIFSGFVAGVEQPVSWLFRVLFIVGGFAFFFSLFQHKLNSARWDRLLLIIALSGLVHAGIGLLQLWLKTDMPYLLPKSVDGTPVGLFQQVNNHASYLVTCIVLSFYLASRPLLLRRRLKLQALLLITVLTSTVIIAISGSRVGLISLAVALPLLLFARRKQLLMNRSLSVLLIMAVLSGGTVGAYGSGGKAIDKTVAMQSGYSGSARLGIYAISLDLLAEKPWFGHGIASFPRVFQYARPDFYEAHPRGKLPEKMVSHPHNELLQWMVEGGLIALIGVLLFVTGVFLAIYKSGASRGGSCLAMLLPIGLHTQVELPFYVSVIHWLLFLVLLSQLFRHSVTSRNNAMTVYAKNLSAASLILVVIVCAYILIHTIRANWDFESFYSGEQTGVPLNIASQNLYLSEEAEWISMGAFLTYSTEKKLDENVRYFVNWGEDKLEQRPDIDLFIKLLNAYDYLGDKSAFCSSLVQAGSLYPSDKRLKEIQFVCGK